MTGSSILHIASTTIPVLDSLPNLNPQPNPTPINPKPTTNSKTIINTAHKYPDSSTTDWSETPIASITPRSTGGSSGS